MQIGRITNATRVLGKTQGYMGLPIRDERVPVKIGTGGDGYSVAMVSAWLPTPKELDALSRGAPVHVRVLGAIHPPMMVEVGEVPE